MQKIDEKKLVIAGLILTGLVFSVLAFVTGIPEGGADNYAHFNIARWAFRYPHLFLDHWGKPVFTILSAPFAQFGFAEVRIFNTIAGLLTAWYTWKLAELLKFKYSWFAAVVVIFTPIYFIMMSTGMTEVVFSLILVISVYLFFREKYILSAITISIIFLARTEGLAFLLPFLIALILKKQYKAIPFLATGFVVFSLIGGVYHYHDFLWLINERPYAKGGPSVYGRGSWYHFFTVMPNYFGKTLRVLLLLGSVAVIVKWIQDKAKLTGEAFLLILLILGTFWGYFFIHSYLWWKGETSAGLQRVMAGVSPVIAVMVIVAVNFFDKYIRHEYIKIAVLAVLSASLVYDSVDFYKRSIGYDLTAEVLNRTTKWLKESGSVNHKLVMHNPYFSFATEIDAWDNNVVQYGFSNNDAPENGLPDSTVFIWDAHFSPNEGRLPLDKIIDNPNFQVIQLFEPVVPFKVFGDNEYRIIIFRKKENSGANNRLILEKLKNDQIDKTIYYRDELTFDIPFQDQNLENRRIKSETDSLNLFFTLNETEFSPSFQILETKINSKVKNKFRVTGEFCRLDTVVQNRLLMVFSAETDNKSYHYVTSGIGEQTPEKNVWYKTDFIFTLPDEMKNGTVIKIYVWNMDKRNVLMDNFKVEISEQAKN